MKIPTTIPSARARIAGFTLIELLLVLAVMTVLLSLVVPAVQSTGAARLTAGGKQVAGLVGAARQTAMSHNTLSALVLLTSPSQSQAYRAFAIIYYKEGEGWVQKGNWELLPEGVVVDASNTADCTFLLDSPEPFPFLTDEQGQAAPPVRYQGAGVQGNNAMVARIFTAGGGLLDASVPSQIRLVEGHVVDGTVQHPRPGADGRPDNFFDIAILGATGLPKISRPQLEP
ncbi:prepilin-type N-terminal cleavage/methylation domain-containing protein [Verrucomicrobium sp. BvORR106]|uniref:prepilin-type N-terminal cleavage/methylation domain-containing protein n=1 Tax=Verrucomicrobium sp. BvORR106 TaxID=1403819 RepID=UPI0009DD7FE2|nr:prepilin-type N-terminal cleavage/methylation domain-containing protein [Verrucomicrobium sp. BvORR106]